MIYYSTLCWQHAVSTFKTVFVFYASAGYLSEIIFHFFCRCSRNSFFFCSMNDLRGSADLSSCICAKDNFILKRHSWCITFQQCSHKLAFHRIHYHILECQNNKGQTGIGRECLENRKNLVLTDYLLRDSKHALVLMFLIPAMLYSENETQITIEGTNRIAAMQPTSYHYSVVLERKRSCGCPYIFWKLCRWRNWRKSLLLSSLNTFAFVHILRAYRGMKWQ